MPSRSVSPMNQPTPAYFVCSPRSRVGKTTLARLIADYHAVESRPFIVYDTDPEHTAAGHYPDRTDWWDYILSLPPPRVLPVAAAATLPSSSPHLPCLQYVETLQEQLADLQAAAGSRRAFACSCRVPGCQLVGWVTGSNESSLFLFTLLARGT